MLVISSDSMEAGIYALGLPGNGNLHVTLMPSTSLSLTARSTVFKASLAASVADFWSWIPVEKAARGADEAIVRGIWRVATRRAAVCREEDMVACVLVLVEVRFSGCANGL